MAEVTLFTRPRRFGKTLALSMLKAFFALGADEKLFDGLYISKNKEFCEKYMGKYPVIFLSLSGVMGNDFNSSRLSQKVEEILRYPRKDNKCVRPRGK